MLPEKHGGISFSGCVLAFHIAAETGSFIQYKNVEGKVFPVDKVTE